MDYCFMDRERKGRKEGRRKGRRQLFATTALLYGIEGYELRALSLSLSVFVSAPSDSNYGSKLRLFQFKTS